MIAGIFLRNFKTYSGINYIPISAGKSFCGLVGNNGIGKSSVLEALDSFYNGKPWNYNTIVKKSGFKTTSPHIVPIFIMEKENISEDNKEIAGKISDFVWKAEEADIISQNRNQFKIFSFQREMITKNINKDDYYILPIGKTHENKPSLSIFNTKKLGEIIIENFEGNTIIKEEDLSILEDLLKELKSIHEYIYIPKDIDPENFTQLETKEIQSLMGETLNEIVEKCVPQGKIHEINQSLNRFIDSVSNKLENYSFRTSGERQVNLRKHDVYKLIVEAYFKIRKLHKKEGSHYLEMSILSSGEKQKAIIELAYNFLKNYRDETKNIILAIDEPESSLHMSACYDQFDKLFEISTLCKQLLFTTHWYGFIPTAEDGGVTVISKKDKDHLFDLVSIPNYREGIKQAIRDSRGNLPFDIRLKSINDFTQSIITSILLDEPYNWLICEGSSEKIYFEGYFENIIQEKKLRIIPVGGAREIKRIYNNLQVAYEDFKNEIQGKVVLLMDTDKEIVQFPINQNLKNLLCYRIVNDNHKTKLVKVDSNPVSPKTEIEDCLNGKLLYNTLMEFKQDHPELEKILSTIEEPTEGPSYFSLDLPPSKAALLNSFFDKDNIKFDFANKYISKIEEDYLIPDWIKELRNIY